VLSAAGSYVVKVTIGGKMVPGWPQPLHIVPGAAVAAKSWLTGASLEVRLPRRPVSRRSCRMLSSASVNTPVGPIIARLITPWAPSVVFSRHCSASHAHNWHSHCSCPRLALAARRACCAASLRR